MTQLLSNNPDRRPSNRTATTLPIVALGVFFGLIAGFWFPQWQAVVEGGQVLVGLVTYPEGNPQGIYHQQLWTILNQAAGVMLVLGLSEQVVSAFFTGIGATVFFVGVALIAHAFCRNWMVSVLTPLLVLITDVAGSASGNNYPILLLDTPHTYGWMGSTVVLLVLGLIGIGKTSLAFFFIGILPAVHPTWGLWVNIASAFFCVFYREVAWMRIRQSGKFLLLGYAITLMSLLFAYDFNVGNIFGHGVPSSDLIAIYLQKWDAHRYFPHWSEFSLHHTWPGQVALMSLMLVGAHLYIQEKVEARRDPAHLGMMGIVFFGGFVTWVISFWVWFGAEHVPTTVRLLMPVRLLNVLNLIFIPILFGLMGRGKSVIDRVYLVVTTLIVLFAQFQEFETMLARWILAAMVVSVWLGSVQRKDEFRHHRVLTVWTGCLFLAPIFLVTPLALIAYPDGRLNILLLMVSSAWVLLILFTYAAVIDESVSRRWLKYLGLIWIGGALNFFITPLIDKNIIGPNDLKSSLVILVMISLGFLILRNEQKLKNQISAANAVATERIVQPLLSSRQLGALKKTKRGEWILNASLISILIVAIGHSANGTGFNLKKRELRDWSNDAFWEKVSRDQKLLLTGSNLGFIQLKIRRPVLLDGGAIDYFPYIAEAQSVMVEILKDVYGIDFRSRREAFSRRGSLAKDEDKEVWEKRSLDHWRVLGKRYDFKDILVYEDWSLQLPKLSSAHGLALYRVPAEME